MKNILFIFLIGISSTCFGQDSLNIKFRQLSAGMNSDHIEQLRVFFKDRKAEQVKLTAYFSTDGNASQKRILAELRLQMVRLAIQNQAIPFNIISSSIKPLDISTQRDHVRIEAFFANVKGVRVLRKTSVVQVSEFDFVNASESEKIVKKDNENAEKEIVLNEAAFKKDATVSLPNLIFIGSTHYFLSGSERVLRALLKVMKSRPDIEIELQGHVCCNPPGVDAYNKITGLKNLSVSRAQAVREYLIQGGISSERMTYKGFGSSKRLYPEEKNAREQMLNRRVEVLITASDK